MQKYVLEHLAEGPLIVLAFSCCWTLGDLLLRSTCNVLRRSREEVFLVISFRNITALSHRASLVLTAWDTVEHWLAGISSLRALCYSTVSEDLGQLDTGMSSSVINRHFSHWEFSPLFSISILFCHSEVINIKSCYPVFFFHSRCLILLSIVHYLDCLW